MKFNYASEKNRFERRWARLRREYTTYGMSPEAIDQMYRFDWKEFKEHRNYCLHTQFYPKAPRNVDDINTDSKSPIYLRFLTAVSVEPVVSDRDDPYGWINEIDDPELFEAVWGLSPAYKNILTLNLEYGYSFAEIARLQGISRQAVSAKMNRIRHYLKKIRR